MKTKAGIEDGVKICLLLTMIGGRIRKMTLDELFSALKVQAKRFEYDGGLLEREQKFIERYYAKGAK